MLIDLLQVPRYKVEKNKKKKIILKFYSFGNGNQVVITVNPATIRSV